MLWIIIAVAGLAAVVGWSVTTSNNFKRMLIKIEEADSGIDVALTKRYDMLTKMLSVCKGYAKHEIEALTGIVKLRRGMAIEEKNQANHQMDEMQQRLNIIAESYPELKSSQNFLSLQQAIVEAEEHLQAARRVYNMNVSTFNQAIVLFPASIIAGAQHQVAKGFFEAEEHKKADVEMNF